MYCNFGKKFELCKLLLSYFLKYVLLSSILGVYVEMWLKTTDWKILSLNVAYSETDGLDTPLDCLEFCTNQGFDLVSVHCGG